MSTETLTFSGVVCFIDDLKIDSQNFKSVVTEGNFDSAKGDHIAIFNLEYQDNYLKISFSDGSAMPRNPQVYNQSRGELEPNPRSTDQIEPKEYFAVIDLANSYLWLSNIKKKKLLINYFQSLFSSKKITLKDVYDEQKFIEGIKSIDQLKIKAAPSLFSAENSLSKALTDDMYGAHEAILHLKYKNTFVGEDLKARIKSVFKDKESFSGIMIAGRDENNLGMFFNNNLFSRKIDIKTIVDTNKMFDPNDVFTKLITKINNENNAST